MSMVTLTLLQLAGIFCAYLFVTIGLPAYVFGRKMQGRRATERFLLYYMIGNFYVMNLVFILQLLRISHPVTLILGTLVPVFVARVTLNGIPFIKIAADFANNVRKLEGGQMGAKTALYKTAGFVRTHLGRFFRYIGYFLVYRFGDCVFLAAVLAALWWVYGRFLIIRYGYQASDVVVHNYWINALNDNQIFVGGVYPQGFHCIVYYLHAVFGFDTYVILRVFAFVQNVMIHMMLLSFLKLCCRSRYLPYAGVGVYVTSTFINSNTIFRYYATLPQEFGMIFILPSIYFIFAFFQQKKRELDSEKEGNALTSPVVLADNPPEEIDLDEIRLEDLDEIRLEDLDENISENAFGQSETGKKTSRKRFGTVISKRRREPKELPKGRRRVRKYPEYWLYLAGFAISFSMTLSVHFYNTIIAGLFCAAIAVGYVSMLFKKQYFWNVMAAGLISVSIAVAPMAVAFIGGTPMEGSLRWAMSIIRGDSGNSTVVEEIVIDDIQDDSSQGTTSQGAGGAAVGVGGSVEGSGEDVIVETPKVSVGERVTAILAGISVRAQNMWSILSYTLNAYIFVLQDLDNVHWIMWAFLALIVLGLLYKLFRRYCYGAMLMSTGIYIGFMCLLIMAESIGLPALMDASRVSIYFSYTVFAVLTMLLDGVLYLPFFPWRNKAAKVGAVLLNFLSLVCVGGVISYLAVTGDIRDTSHGQGQEINEGIASLTNIIRNEKDFSWTIVSANDETQMSWDHGYHYETVNFLLEMEDADPATMIRIPTNVVFFFIEKIPIDYNISYEDSGQTVSEEGAKRELPAFATTAAYQGEWRWILMSRMYYWAQEFQRMYPDEMEVYLETDNFICYRIEQNTYKLYNFAIDYGYNNYSVD